MAARTPKSVSIDTRAFARVSRTGRGACPIIVNETATVSLTVAKLIVELADHLVQAVGGVSITACPHLAPHFYGRAAPLLQLGPTPVPTPSLGRGTVEPSGRILVAITATPVVIVCIPVMTTPIIIVMALIAIVMVPVVMMTPFLLIILVGEQNR